MPYKLMSPDQTKALKRIAEKSIYPDREEKNTHALLSLDPGWTTGWARFSDVGRLVDFGQVEAGTKGIREFFYDNPLPEQVIFESFQIRGVAQYRGELPASVKQTLAVIRQIKDFCRQKKIPCHMVQPSNKPIAQRWTQLNPLSDHNHSHWTDAANHGFHWNITKKILIPPLLWDQEIETKE